MKKKVHIVPAILAKEKEDLISMIRTVEPYVSRVQIDIIDGEFANNRTNDDISKIKTNLKFEVHLMVNDPVKYIKKYKNTAWMITVHYESFENDEDLLEAINLIKKYKVKAGLAVSPMTGIYRIQDFVSKVDLVLVMSVKPGFGGQNFLEGTFGRISTVRALSSKADVEVDGGVRLSLVKDLVKSGCNVIVAGKAITHQYDQGETVKKFKEQIKEALDEV